jgi:hypothetical protein
VKREKGKRKTAGRRLFSVKKRAYFNGGVTDIEGVKLP